MDTPCECDIFRNVSPIHFKLNICFHITWKMDAIFFLPSAKNEMSAMLSLRCEHDTSPTISLIDSYLMS